MNPHQYREYPRWGPPFGIPIKELSIHLRAIYHLQIEQAEPLPSLTENGK